MSFTTPLSGFRLIATRLDDTLQAIAGRELGDASQWPVLANVNGLLPPYITSDPTMVVPGVILGGTSIKIPAAAPPLSGVVDPTDIFGIDIALQDGQLVDDGSGDLLTVSGPDNLRQAVVNRLGTNPGELVFHQAYGCKIVRLKGRGGSATINGLAAIYASQALQADPRISSVPSSTATITGDNIEVTAVAETVDGKRLPVGNTLGVTF
jgi:phage baseplate assembly protein W